MSFEQTEVSAFVQALPQNALNAAGKEAAEEWCSFLVSVDSTPKARHDVFWYLSMGRFLAEAMGTTSQLDLAEPAMRGMITATIKPGEKPYDTEGESAEFRAWSVLPAQIAFALRVQDKCAKQAPPAPTPEATLASTMKDYLEAQAASQKRSAKALSFKLSDRLVELGLQDFPEDGLPSEENLAVFEAAGRVAREKGRLYVGSAEGEDLQKHFRPAWSKLPRVDVPVGDGGVAERHRQMADFRKAKAATELDYPSYASFQSHLLDWGMKLVLLKVVTPVDVLGYTLLLSKLSEENGGVRSAYQCDILARKATAKALEKGDPQWKRFFSKVDADLARGAKEKVKDRASEAAKLSSAKTTGPKGGYNAGSGAGGSAGSAGNGKGSPDKGARKGGPQDGRTVKSPPPARSRSPWPKKDQWQGGNRKGWSW